MLVSWARLLSGRFRDPLVGRDVLIGVAAGTAISAIEVLAWRTAAHFGLTGVRTFVSPGMLGDLTGVNVVAGALGYTASTCLLRVLTPLVIVLLCRLLFRSTTIGLVVTVLFLTIVNGVLYVPGDGWLLGSVEGLVTTAGVVLA